MTENPLVSRLRAYKPFDEFGISNLRNPDGPEAADHIESLEAENARLRAKARTLVSACDGLEWNSFTEAGWKCVNDLRASLNTEGEDRI